MSSDVEDLEIPMANENIAVTTICSDAEKSLFKIESIAKQGELKTASPVPTIQQRYLPRIKVLGTGGTIAAKGSSSSSTAGYKVDLTIQDMLGAIPRYLQDLRDRVRTAM